MINVARKAQEAVLFAIDQTPIDSPDTSNLELVVEKALRLRSPKTTTGWMKEVGQWLSTNTINRFEKLNHKQLPIVKREERGKRGNEMDPLLFLVCVELSMSLISG